MGRVRGRLFGALAFVVSGVAFVVALGFLYAAEGPGSPDILSTLSSPSGRGLFAGAVAAGIIAVLAYVAATVPLYFLLRELNEVAALEVLVIAAVVAPIMVSFLAFQYIPVAVAQEGFAVHDTGFRQLVVTAHAFADVGGWTTIAMLAASSVVIGIVVRRKAGWRWISLGSLALGGIAVILFALSASYLFLGPFGLWEVALGATLARAAA